MSRNRFLFILLAILVLIGVTEALGRGQAAPVLIAVSFLATTLQVATPLTLGALSGLYCERAGVVNIAIEGMMLGAAFFGWLASIYASAAGLPTIAALLAGVLAALLAGALLSRLCWWCSPTGSCSRPAGVCGRGQSASIRWRPIRLGSMSTGCATLMC